MNLFIASVLTSLVLAAPAFAADTLNLTTTTQTYFPTFTGDLQTVSANGFCKLSIQATQDSWTLQISTSQRAVSKFTAPVLFLNESAQIEQTGRNKEQGYYSYAKFSQGKNNTTLVKGISYYEPSYDRADSLLSTVSEQKILFTKKENGVQIQVWQSSGEKPLYFDCLF